MSWLDSFFIGVSNLLVNGVSQTKERGVNLVAGTNVTITASDNPSSGRADVTIASTGGGGSTPTGTGIPHIVGGVQNAAASLIVNADIAAATGIAGSKINPSFGSAATINGLNLDMYNPAGTFVTRIINDAIITTNQQLTLPLIASNDVFAVTGLAQTLTNKTLTSPIINTSIVYGTGTLPSVGLIRFPNTTGLTNILTQRDTPNTLDLEMISTNPAAYKITVGDTGTPGTHWSIAQLAGQQTWITFATTMNLGTNSADLITLSTTQIQASMPIVGSATYTSPYGVHGAVSMVSATGSLTAAQYAYAETIFTGTPGSTQTMTYPNPATAAAGYFKYIRNASASSVVVTTGAGATVTIPTLQAALVVFENSNCYHVGTIAAY